jgi:alanyl-tRNA synthetase
MNIIKIKNGNLRKLEFPGVDTGMGFERLMKVLQKSPTIFETDLFKPLNNILGKFNEKRRSKKKKNCF